MQFETKPDTHVHFRVYWDVADPAKSHRAREETALPTKLGGVLTRDNLQALACWEQP